MFVWKDENKQKEAEDGPFFKKTITFKLHDLVGIVVPVPVCPSWNDNVLQAVLESTYTIT